MNRITRLFFCLTNLISLLLIPASLLAVENPTVIEQDKQFQQPSPTQKLSIFDILSESITKDQVIIFVRTSQPARTRIHLRYDDNPSVYYSYMGKAEDYVLEDRFELLPPTTQFGPFNYFLEVETENGDHVRGQEIDAEIGQIYTSQLLNQKIPIRETKLYQADITKIQTLPLLESANPLHFEPGSSPVITTNVPSTTPASDTIKKDFLYVLMAKLRLERPPFNEFLPFIEKYGLNMFYLTVLLVLLALALEVWYLVHRARPWGVVYDAQLKKPIPMATIRLFDKDSNRLLETKTSDQNGRFSFLVKPGKYYIDVQKTGYHFPSRIITSQDQEYFPNVYRGQIISIKGEGVAINVSIPIDAPTVESAEEKAQINLKLLIIYRWRRLLLVFLTFLILIIFWLMRIPAMIIVIAFAIIIWLVEIVLRRKSTI